MAQKKKPPLTPKTSKTKKNQPLTAEVELQHRQEELGLINRELALSQVELEAAYRQYTDLYDFAPVGYITLARNGAIQQVNLAMANMLGINHDEVTRLRLAAFVSSESRPAFDVFFEKLLSGEGKETCELVLEKRGHGLLWARLEATCFESGNVCRAMLTDITERKRMEQILQESENRFRTLLQDVSTIAVQGYAIDGTTQYWNTASERLYGYSAEEALGQSLLDLIIPPEMRSEVWQAIQQMGETGQPIPAAELSLMRKDGSRVSVYSSHAIVSVPGRVPELFCLDVDLTERRRAEKALQESESRYRELIELAVDGILMGSPEGIIIGANSYMLHLTGRTLTNLVGKHVNELFNPDELKSTPLRFDLLQKGETVTNERQLIRLDGKVIPVEMHTKMMPDGTYQSIYRDITERKQAEELLKESEWRTRIVSELTTDYIFVVDVDPSRILKFRWVSDNLFRITGRTVEDVATSDKWGSMIHPDDRDRFFDFVNQILSTAEVGEFECRSFYKHGGERWIRIFARPQVGEGNKVTTIVGAIQDITERKQAEDALKASTEFANNLIASMQDGVSVLDKNGVHLDVNSALCRITGFSREELIGSAIPHPYWPAEEYENIEAALQQTLEDTHNSFELTFMRKDGERFPVIVSPFSIKDNLGNTVSYAATVKDITERKQAEQALRESENLYRKMNENSPLGMHFYKLNDNNQLLFVGANPAADKLLGIDNSQFIGKTIEEAFPPLIQTEVPSRYRDAAGKGIPWSTEQIVYADKKITGAFDVRAFQTSPGNMVAVFAEVTERKQAEQALRQNQELFSLFMLHSPIYAFIKEVTPSQSRVLQASDNYQQMIGISGRDMVGKTMEELFPAEAAAKFTADDWTVVASGEVLKLDEDLNGRHYTTIKFPITQGDKTLLAGYSIDITERVRVQEALRLSEEKYRTVANFTYDWETWRGPDGAYLYISPSCERVSGRTAAEFLEDPKLIIKITHPDDRPKVRTHFDASSNKSKELDLHLDFRIVTPDGQTRWIAHYCTAVYSEDGQWLGRRESNRDITERKQAEQALETANRELQTALALQQQLAHTDALTGINNRRHLYELADHEFEIAARYLHPLSAIMFDIDHFKEINDTFGHAAGDQILQRVTQVACANLRSADVIGRYGGEEFVVILPMTNAKQAYPLAERIRTGVEAIRVATEKGDASVTLSIGIVEMIHVTRNGSAEELIRRADEAMYAAKQAGRNRTEIGE